MRITITYSLGKRLNETKSTLFVAVYECLKNGS